MATNTKKTSGRNSGASKSKKNTKSTAKGRKNTSARGRQVRNEQEQAVRLEVILICVLAFAVFLFIANFGKCGTFGNAISGFFFGLIGSVEYFFPVYMFFSAAFIVSNRFDRRILKKIIYVGVLLCMFSMLCQMLSASDFESVKSIYMDGYKNHKGGGLIAGLVFFLLRTVIGIPGTIIVMVVVTAIMFMLLCEISIEGMARDIKDSISVHFSDEKKSERSTQRKKRRREQIDEFGLLDDDMDDLEETGRNKGPRVDMNNINVFDSTRKTPSRKGKTDSPHDVHEVKDKPRDFFDIDPDDNGIERINMHDETEQDRAEAPKPRNRRTKAGTVSKTAEAAQKIASGTGNLYPGISGAGVKGAAGAGVLQPNTSGVGVGMSKPKTTDFGTAGKATIDMGEDVLAGAVNGNLHPETISDYSPEHDSAFESVTGGSGAAAAKASKPAARKNESTAPQKSYTEGGRYTLPDASLLTKAEKQNNTNRDAYVRETAIKLKNTLENFGVNVTITNYSCGPAVTRFEMQPEQGVKVSKILNLADDIKLNLAAADIRIEAPIPGKAAIGIEVPNKEISVVTFRELVESENFKKAKSKISFAVGMDISGQVITTDIAKMPHLLIAGSTGSGKSVCINTLIMSILFKARPEEVKLIMVDPKMVELTCYNGIPHLLIPVVTDPKKAAGALNWAVEEMTRRYQLFADTGVRNLTGYNEKVADALASGGVDPEKLTKLSQIVVIVDELADLMMVAHGEVEDAIVRLSQLARAAGIHLVIATQRPSVDVITGLIKANVPSRIAFAVSSGVDSRTILDMNGAEKLLGKGDMLFYPTGFPKPVRVQGAFISDDEVARVVDYLKKSNGVGTYDESVSNSIASGSDGSLNGAGSGGNDRDEYFIEAGKFIIDKEKASIGMLQRAFKIGFNRAARIMDQLADAGVVGPEEGTKARKILMSEEQFEQYIDEYY